MAEIARNILHDNAKQYLHQHEITNKPEDLIRVISCCRALLDMDHGVSSTFTAGTMPDTYKCFVTIPLPPTEDRAGMIEETESRPIREFDDVHDEIMPDNYIRVDGNTWRYYYLDHSQFSSTLRFQVIDGKHVDHQHKNVYCARTNELYLINGRVFKFVNP